ncbi:MAG: AbrB/MazE/SpoVT family DNA-binding domain-containing protein [Peptococcaceae bacterium]|jgi:antitoxin MazE|nr:AbrB/MazE/SpoVT family DNA-binding domain-containing protein [Peptococcaceae bacterium]
MQTTIVKWGNSQGIRLPKLLLDSVNLSYNDEVDIIVENNSLIMKKAEKRNPYKTIQERFKDFNGEYEPIEINWGTPVGEEIW